MVAGAHAELHRAQAILLGAGLPTPRVDAEILLAHITGVPRGQLLLHDSITDSEQADFHAAVDHRAAGEPVQHITGTAWFRHLDLAVGSGVFIPRPETEVMLEIAGQDLRAAGSIVDLGAGSGAIALSVAIEFRPDKVYAIENSAAALPWLRRNVERLIPPGTVDVEVIADDLGSPDVLNPLSGSIDVILSNPPYVPSSLRSVLPLDVLNDPEMAVFAGIDGLSVMPAVIRTAARLLRPGGVLVVEHDDSHQDGVLELFSPLDWVGTSTHRDLADRPRFVRAVRA